MNAEYEENDKNSVLNFYRERIRLRQDNPYSHILVMAYERVLDDLGILTFYNFQNQNAE
ncbi:hypothetical protein [Blautia pseudococcoides]